MDDKQAIAFLAWKLGNARAVAEALGISAQRLSNWRHHRRGISAEMRPVIWAMVNDHGGNLSRDWLIRRPTQQPSVAA